MQNLHEFWLQQNTYIVILIDMTGNKPKYISFFAYMLFPTQLFGPLNPVPSQC